MKTNQKHFEALKTIALDLTAAISAEDRYTRLLDALNKVIPYDAAALMLKKDNTLIPLASRGLSLDAMGRHYLNSEHPRLDIICRSREPVRFDAESGLPDPFDGLLINDNQTIEPIHSCMGCPLYASDKLIGVLTADAFDPHAFDSLDQEFLTAISALAGAQLQTVELIQALEMSAKRQGQIANDLMHDMHTRHGSELVGSSQAMQHLKREIELVARSDFTVLVLGETGVGKELVVRSIHKASNRYQGPMLYLNCAALPENLAESELFGHAKGAFTGASLERVGKFELADGGTLFLDEIGELSLSIQAKLLRVIQEGEVQRVGSDTMKKVNVRLLAATNRNLEKEVEEGRFRADLFHRLNVYPIKVPPLRERKTDIQLLTGYFCEKTQRQLGTKPVRISPEAMDLLMGYSWPGNVRELENTLSRTILKAQSVNNPNDQIILKPENLSAGLIEGEALNKPQNNLFHHTPEYINSSKTLRELTVDFQIAVIRKVLDQNNGSWAAAGRDLGIHRSNLHSLAKRLGMN